MTTSTETTLEPQTHQPAPDLPDETAIEEAVTMTRSCARDLTDRIKAGVTDVAEMLHRAHEGRAWEALSYPSWKTYCESEFQMSERHSYRLLDFVQIRTLLTDQLVSPTSESQTRPLAGLSPDQQAVAWKGACDLSDGAPPTAKQVEESAAKILYPVERRPPSPEAIAARELAATMSKNVWQLHGAWKCASKKDKRAFRELIGNESEPSQRAITTIMEVSPQPPQPQEVRAVVTSSEPETREIVARVTVKDTEPYVPEPENPMWEEECIEIHTYATQELNAAYLRAAAKAEAMGHPQIDVLLAIVEWVGMKEKDIHLEDKARWKAEKEAKKADKAPSQ